ncbi:MAG: protoheme IX farnesyltransferase [Oligoflexia bacterium]|nr:protoheme IX farnesyltransferase [Oligoflexia bacterium]
MKSVISSYVRLTKPTIVLLFALTGFTALYIEGSLLSHPLRLAVVMFGICLTAGSANALNMYFDRDIDELMARTKKKRPLPLKSLSPTQALYFGVITGFIAMGCLIWAGSTLSAALGLFTILFYVGVYTLYLKRRTPYNIVIGGAAGATAPLMAWAAGSQNIDLLAWVLFLIIFMWTPPHFWALALVVKDDYKEAKVPMLPVVAGDERTRWEILIYTVLLVPLTFLPVLTKAGGLVYLGAAAILNLIFVKMALKLKKDRNNNTAYRMFGFSIVYLFGLFLALIAGQAALRGSS